MATVVIVVAKLVAVLWSLNVAIERYADWKMTEMGKVALTNVVPSPEQLLEGRTVSQKNGSTVGVDSLDDEALWTSAQLRKTIYQGSGLVENIQHRKAWNRWLSTTPTTETLTAAPERFPKSLDPGMYRFAYRSYVNYEEAGAIRKRLYHLPTWIWGYVQPTPGIMTFFPLRSNVTVTSDNSSMSVQLVTNEEIVQFRWRTLLRIYWDGYWDPSTCCIHWTNSTLEIHRRKWNWWNFWKRLSLHDISNSYNNSTSSYLTSEVVVRPERSEELRKIPWQLVKVEDGMVAFQRGEIGMLVYDKQDGQV
jgi:hypothetical protein